MTAYPPLYRAWVWRLALKRFVFLSAVAMAVGPLYAFSVRLPGSAGEALGLVTQSFVHGALIGIPLAAAEAIAFVVGSRAGMRSRLSFSVIFLAKTAVYAIWIVAGAAIAGSFTHAHDETPLEDLLLHKGTLIAAATTAVLLNVVLTVGRLIGPKTLMLILSGHYHRPRREERVIAFVDVRGATSIAEALGDVSFQEFLIDLFRIIEVTAMETGGEIHDYVGDQAMITWPVPHDLGVRGVEPLRWVADLGRVMAEMRPTFEAKYGYTPDVRIGMHLGSVVMGEVGIFRTKLACLGDTVNTAARVEELAHDLAHEQRTCALVTGRVLERFPLPKGFDESFVGNAPLRGKNTSISIHRICIAA